MKHLLVLVLFGLLSLLPGPRVEPQLMPYIEFLRQQKTSAKDYILQLFEKHDLIIICERSHADVTQYDLYLDVIRDERFIRDVGTIFTEIGVSTLEPALNEFLHADGLPADSIDRQILRLHRNASFYPLWEKQNFSNFLRRMYDLNQQLTAPRKITVYPSDMPFSWNAMDESRLRQFWSTIDSRDSVMAAQIIERFDTIRSSPGQRKKALVIMNYRHAFGHRFERPIGTRPNNVGRFLFDRYGTRAANVYVNWIALAFTRSDSDVTFTAVHDGKWDAAFKAVNKEDAGFDFDGSPFGEDHFDIYPFREHPFRFKDVFDGFVYYLPLEKQKQVIGVPGLIDSLFAQEFLRRQQLHNLVREPDRKQPPNLEQERRYYNDVREIPLDGLDSLHMHINKWLR